MQTLTAKVYECSFGVEAHMICDLLVRAGIDARVEGEFLQGAGGELPMGSGIKVRVAPENAAEARAVIDEWEKLQPDEATVADPRPSSRPMMWFIAGFVLGGLSVAFVLVR